ncbi:hypothetical protein K501DRAFT_269738 [Backusella circina FSU 941]|nr:hypothetical protein K501DRAFT_269738 [Backusella circina FSU 941]
MIQRLPLEIILTISNYLDFENKLTLITTCRGLHDLISNTNLYSDLNLLRDKRTVNSIIQKFDDGGKLDGAQVKRLWIDTDKVSHQYYGQLSILFPNVTRLVKYNERLNFRDKIGNARSYPVGPMVEWIDTLETYIVPDDGPDLMNTLEVATFPRLNKLNLDLLCYGNGKEEGFDFLYFLKYIQHAPALKNLTLNHCAISLALLDGIHTSCPYLESLHLNQTAIVVRESTLPQSIVPTYSILQLKISQSLVFDKKGLLLDYITSRYRHLRSLDLHFKPKYHAKQLGVYLKEGSEYLFSDGESDSDDDESGQSEETQNLYDSLEEDFKLVAPVYQASESKFFSNLPKTLKTLELGTPFTGNVIKELVKSNINPVALHFFKHNELRLWKLKDLEQLEYIRKMTSLKSLKMGINPKVQTHHLDFVSKTVTKLYIRFENHPFYIDWVMSMFPSLEELWIDCPPYSSAIKLVNRDAWKSVAEKTYPKLLVIKATYSPIDQNFLGFCKRVAPNVAKLDLTIDFPSKRRTVGIDLLGWKVKRCSLSLPGFSPYEREHFIINITIQGITRRFIFQSLYGNTTLTNSTIKSKMERVVNIISDDSQQIVIGGFTLVRVGSKILIDL